MKNLPSASVALCTFNGQEYIEDQLKSLYEQSSQIDEVIICDDSSDDKTVNSIHKVAVPQGIALKVFVNKERLGVDKNFEKAISFCTKQIIFICDQDDLWDKNKVALYLEEFARDDSVAMVVSDSIVIDQYGNPDGTTVWENERFKGMKHYTRQQQFRSALKHSPFPGHSFAFKKSFVEYLLPIPEEWMYDQWVAKLCAAYGTLRLLPLPMTYYRQHNKQAIGSREQNLVEKARTNTKLDEEYFELEIARYSTFKKRLDEVRNLNYISGLEYDMIQVLEEKIKFIERRKSMRRSGTRRLLGVICNLVKFDYFKYGRGWLTIARDLVG